MKHILKTSSIIFIALVSFNLISCQYGLWEFLSHNTTVNERTQEIKELTDTGTISLASALSAKGTYKILVISDVHFGKPNTRHDDDFLAWLDSLDDSDKPDFCISLGDSADKGLQSELDDYNALLEKIQARLVNTDAPIYTVLGNHDLYNSGWLLWKESVYPYTSLYHFSTNGFSYYFMDSASDSVGANQIKLLKSAFEKDNLPKIVSMHCPIYTDGKTKQGYFTLQDPHEVDELITLFAKYNVKLVLSGHTHSYCRTSLGKFLLYNVPGFLTLPPESKPGRGWSIITVNESKGIIQNDEVIFQEGE